MGSSPSMTFEEKVPIKELLKKRNKKQFDGGYTKNVLTITKLIVIKTDEKEKYIYVEEGNPILQKTKFDENANYLVLDMLLVPIQVFEKIEVKISMNDTSSKNGKLINIFTIGKTDLNINSSIKIIDACTKYYNNFSIKTQQNIKTTELKNLGVGKDKYGASTNTWEKFFMNYYWVNEWKTIFNDNHSFLNDSFKEEIKTEIEIPIENNSLFYKFFIYEFDDFIKYIENKNNNKKLQKQELGKYMIFINTNNPKQPMILSSTLKLFKEYVETNITKYVNYSDLSSLCVIPYNLDPKKEKLNTLLTLSIKYIEIKKK